MCLEDCFEGVICFETLNNNPVEEPQSMKCSINETDDINKLSSATRIICKPALESFQAAAIIANIDPNKTVS